MKLLFLMLACCCALKPSAQAVYQPRIESCECPVKVDSSFQTVCGYLIVPENRKKKNSPMIRLPYVMVKSKDPAKRRDPLLFTGGGPGGSSLRWATGITRRPFIANRDCIAFEQRGTRWALPNLWSSELVEAIQDSYRKNLNKDSMVLEGVKRYKKAFQAKGIDPSGYNTDETVADIHDLLATLHIDSVNLLSGSYGGGLMMAVLKKDSSRIRSLVLDSPLPTFVPIDEDEPANFNEALKILFRRCREDSADKTYGGLEPAFQQYFIELEGKSFSITYSEKGKPGLLNINYTRNELLQAIVNALSDRTRIKDVPFMISQMIKGHHEPYVKEVLDGVFNGNAPSGMRISVYCADQTAYHDEAILQQLYQVYPWMKGYHINDVYKEMCDCWQVPPIHPSTKQPFYSGKPALLADGEMDPACSPLYVDRLHHYLPNSQRFLFLRMSHGVLGGKEVDAMVKEFLDQPFKKLASANANIIAY